MTSQSIQQILSRTLYTGGAEIITKRTLHELLRLNSEFDGTLEWREQLVAITDTFYSLSNGLSILHFVALAMIEDHWEDFDLNWRMTWGNDFLTFVYKKYQRKPNTVRNDLRAVRTFLLNDNTAAPFGTIEMPIRDETGAIKKDDSGKCLTEQVEWDPTKSTIAKLKVALPLIEQDKMTPATWAMMMDDHISSSQMVQTIFAEHEHDPQPPQLEIRFRLDGPCITAYENGKGFAGVAFLDFEGYDEYPYSLKHRAIDKLLALLGLTLDEHLTLLETKENDNGHYYDNQGTPAQTEE